MDLVQYGSDGGSRTCGRVLIRCEGCTWTKSGAYRGEHFADHGRDRDPDFTEQSAAVGAHRPLLPYNLMHSSAIYIE
jgi:hypothetical protein